ncbi:hypothetical protein DQ04_05221020 [Trypanosoma grayi]|uniref:hypothetical protein n=1 Tax=Trypanosoma grayi TaxID=71804 RepID=UPI0004F4BA10|nr:hypothetical protein DQ04_05221020 [Trypanosoma grayi]KEG09438.1 hypothetical protein DQ04_05221020 [Trypanosoma grayi]
MVQRSLTEQVEEIAFAQSALPAALTSEKLKVILSSLEVKDMREIKRRGGHLFGAGSICAQSSSSLVTQGCPSRSRVQSSFVAAAAHSELGMMMHWFASAVVELFEDGVKNGVAFPQQWEEYVRQHPSLTKHTFELQGFSVLYSYLMCQLAVVEGALSECGLSGEYSAAMATAAPPRLHGSKENTNMLGGIKEHCEFTEVTRPGGVVEPRAVDSGTARKRVTTTSDAFSHRNVSASLAQPPLTLALATGHLQSGWDDIGRKTTSDKTKLPPLIPVMSSSLPPTRCNQLPHMAILPPQKKQPQKQRGRHDGGSSPKDGKDPLLYPQRRVSDNLALTSLHIHPFSTRAKKGEGENGTARLERAVSGSGAHSPQRSSFGGLPLNEGTGPNVGRLSDARPSPLRVEDIEQELRSRELCKLYGVKKIVNYSKRDLQEYNANMPVLWDVLDAEDDTADAT